MKKNATEITVILKDSERSYRQKFLQYDDLMSQAGVDQINLAIAEAGKNFEGDPEDIQVRLLMVIK